MLGLKEDSPLEMLRQFAVYFDADLTENFGAAQLVLDNKEGKGSISLYEIFPGLTAWIYDINLNSELVIDMTFSEDKPYYFGYNVNGYQLQKFPNEDQYQKIQQGQNFVIIGKPGNKAEFIVPSNINYECCYLIINPILLQNSLAGSKRRLQQDLKETFDLSDRENPYRYFGNIDTRTGTYAKIVVRNKRTDLVGRLLTEGAVMNLLGTQIEAHDYDINTENFQPNLSKKELSRITNLGDYILKNIGEKITIGKMSNHLSLSPKKLQMGLRFLYGTSANEYLTKCRLEFAKEMMHTTDKNISEICYSVGYQNRSYFSKVFEERYGILPSSYRQSFSRSNFLFEISYRSLAAENVSGNEVDSIIKTARNMNPLHNITGSIIYHRKIFFQMIEGPKKEIITLFKNIEKDSRHTDIQVMWKGSKLKRDFSDWSMATISDEGVLKVPQQGETKELAINNLLGKLDYRALASENLWRKVRNIIKTSSKN